MHRHINTFTYNFMSFASSSNNIFFNKIIYLIFEHTLGMTFLKKRGWFGSQIEIWMKIQGLFLHFTKNKYSTFFKIIKNYIKLISSRNKFRTIFLFFTWPTWRRGLCMFVHQLFHAHRLHARHWLIRQWVEI